MMATSEFPRTAPDDRPTSAEDGDNPRLTAPSTGRSEIRILFVFDPWQQIVLLVGGDKAGDWRGWYRKAIPRAEQLSAEHIEAMSSGEQEIDDALGRPLRRTV
jgi:Phage derived protein Gp49-like (DUF891)